MEPGDLADKVAFSTWDRRIAPVFDAAREIVLVEASGGQVLRQSTEILPGDSPVAKVAHLAGLGVRTLVCGAISWPMAEVIESRGIRVVPFVAGDLSEIIRQWRSGHPEWDAFAMPGCCGWRRGRLQERRRSAEKEIPMNGNGRGGRGQGGGGGKGRGGGGGRGGGMGGGAGRGGQGRGPIGGRGAAGPGGSCVCPKCGHKEPHEAGAPCTGQKCPQCGTAMTREG